MHHFHDINGMLLVGIDRHFGIHWPTPIPTPMFFWELNVMHPFWMGVGKPNVKFNGFDAVADQHTSHLLWPHVPIIPDPLNMLFPIDLLMGNQKTWLAKGSVHVAGAPGAITLFPGPVSLNMDCWTGSNLPPGLVFQPGTVVTVASLMDWVRAGLRLAVEIVFEYISCRGKVKGTAQGRIPTRPANYSWRNVRRNVAYTAGRNAAGQRSRSTFRNTLGRNLASRLTPWKLGRNSRGRPELQRPGLRDLARWTADNLGILPSTPKGYGDAIDRHLVSQVGNPHNPLDGYFPTPSEVPERMVKGIYPNYQAVTAIDQSSGQRDMNPFG